MQKAVRQAGTTHSPSCARSACCRLGLSYLYKPMCRGAVDRREEAIP